LHGLRRVWTFVLDEHDSAARLISRKPLSPPHARRTHIGMLPMKLGSLMMMERKMLHGIKGRAERLDLRASFAGADGGR
jgi:hypothetical protein